MKISKQILLSLIAGFSINQALMAIANGTKGMPPMGVAISPNMIQQTPVPAYKIVKAIKTANTADLLKYDQQDVSAFRSATLGRWHLSPLMYAIFYHHPEVVTTLLSLTDVQSTLNTLKDINGRTAIYMAIDANDVASLNLLINAGASVNVTDNKGTTPLQAAAKNPEIESIIRQALKAESSTVPTTFAYGYKPA